jgi:hypothetical protein
MAHLILFWAAQPPILHRFVRRAICLANGELTEAKVEGTRWASISITFSVF